MIDVLESKEKGNREEKTNNLKKKNTFFQNMVRLKGIII